MLFDAAFYSTTSRTPRPTIPPSSDPAVHSRMCGSKDIGSNGAKLEEVNRSQTRGSHAANPLVEEDSHHLLTAHIKKQLLVLVRVMPEPVSLRTTLYVEYQDFVVPDS